MDGGADMKQYKLISGDSHIVETPRLWLDHMPAKLKDRAPKIVRLGIGDAWLMEGATAYYPFGLVSCGGLPPDRYIPWIRWEDVRPMCYDPKARAKALDEARVDAELLYGSPRTMNHLYNYNQDPEYHVAAIQAFNNWLSEFCQQAPEHFFGLAVLPTTGVDAAIAEMHRAMRLPGIHGVVLGRYPNGSMTLQPEDDRFWAACVEAKVNPSIHVNLAGVAPVAARGATLETPTEVMFSDIPFFGAFTTAMRSWPIPSRMAELVYDRVFERFPSLTIVFAEVDCGWLPFLKQQMDDQIKRQNPRHKVQFKRKPSEYFENLAYTIVYDTVGVQLRKQVGVDNIMWSNDFPHATCEFPREWERIEKVDFAGVPAAERQKMLAGNAMRLYGIG